MTKSDLVMATQLDPLRTYPYRYRAAGKFLDHDFYYFILTTLFVIAAFNLDFDYALWNCNSLRHLHFYAMFGQKSCAGCKDRLSCCMQHYDNHFYINLICQAPICSMSFLRNSDVKVLPFTGAKS
ncbi:hypothetical protein HRI_003770900 [Hibiscus trionum]|uniref:Uncharacterized protein n=1 Tax=Hibiscus trionum TaxID=183268 RepID=A0A9W7MHT6_HIBTR|nr:hypothetical protein HRI_003770900 [Hibiscus trionum]